MSAVRQVSPANDLADTAMRKKDTMSKTLVRLLAAWWR